MVHFFSQDVFPYYALTPDRGRGPRAVALTSISLYHILVVLAILFFSAMSGFFLGRLSVMDQDRAMLPCEFAFSDSTTVPATSQIDP